MTLIRRIEFSKSNTGAFGTLLTGRRDFRFDYQNTFGPPPVMEVWTNGANASSSWDSTLRVQKLVLTSGATVGQFARYVSTYPIPYTPGHGNELSITFAPCIAAVANTQFTVGIMTPRDGMAFRVKNGSSLFFVNRSYITGAAFASYASNSVAEVDVTATAISGGDVIGAFNGLSGSGSAKNDASAIIERTLLACNAAATRQDTISLVPTSFTGTSTITVIAGWKEVY